MLSKAELQERLDAVAAIVDRVAGLGFELERAKAGLETASTELDAGNTNGPAWRCANALLTVARSGALDDDPGAEADALRGAIELYTSVNGGGRFGKSIADCRQRLSELGLAAEGTGEAPALAPATAEHETTATTPGGHADRSRPRADTPTWEQLDGAWQSDAGPKLTTVLSDLRAFADQVFGCVLAVTDDVVPLLRSDLDALTSVVDGWGIPDDPDAVQERAALCRSRAFDARLDEAEGRRRWLTAAAWNHALWRVSDWTTNRPNVVIDLLGYVQFLQQRRRYRDDSRDFLLGVNELAVRLVTDELPPLVVETYPYLRSWVRHAAGTYLLLAGPDPLAPSLSRYDGRVGRLERDRWAEELLAAWRVEPDKHLSAAVALLNLAGWSAARVRHLLDLLFEGSKTPDVDGVQFWTTAADDVLERSRWVHVGANPWRPAPGSTRQPLQSTSVGSRVELATPVLQALVAELAEGGRPTRVEGAIFRGRRVPTYLCVNDFGPMGILKVDLDERVQREKRNFDLYAKRLHPRYRASECQAGVSIVSETATSQRFRALLTSYVFTEEEQPRSFSTWLCSAPVDAIEKVVHRLFFTALGPWLSHAARRVVDLRHDYPILRPPTGEQSSYEPTKNAATELGRYETEQISREIGARLDPHTRQLADLPGLDSVLLRLATRSGGRPAVNPIWTVAQLGEVHPTDDDIERLIFTGSAALATSNVLVTTCHGDLHGDNVLLVGEADRPGLSIIDFESTHEGHLCKDFARLESAILSWIFRWSEPEMEAIAEWSARSLTTDLAAALPSPPTENVERAMRAVSVLRRDLVGCGQGHWPITLREYQVAILASLLPFARYPDLNPENRRFVVALASIAATALVESSAASPDGISPSQL